MDGNSSARISSWLDGSLHVQDFSNPVTGTSCGPVEATRTYLALWFGGFGIDQDLPGPIDLYIEYIAEWDCSAWSTDNTCVANGLQP